MKLYVSVCDGQTSFFRTGDVGVLACVGGWSSSGVYRYVSQLDEAVADI